MVRKALRLIAVALQFSAVATVMKADAPFPTCYPCDTVQIAAVRK